MLKERSDGLDVLIVGENFDPEFIPLTLNKPWGLFKFYVFNLVELCLEWVSWLEPSNVHILFANLNDDFSTSLHSKWSKSVKNLQIHSFPKCKNVVDLLREVESKSLLKHDFLLIENCATFCSSSLSLHISNFKDRRKQNKNSILTILYTDKDQSSSYPVVGYNTETQKLFHFSCKNSRRNINISKSCFISNATFRTDIAQCGVLLCSQGFISHFSGNYDLCTIDSIIQDILCNEEFLGQQIHLDFVKDSTCFVACDYSSLLQLHSKFILREFFPLTSENVFPSVNDFVQLIHHDAQNNYLPSGQMCPSLANNSVFGSEQIVDESAEISLTSFGSKVKIGKCTRIKNCIFGENSSVGDNCSLQQSIVGENVKISDRVKIAPNSIIGSNVIIPEGTNIEVPSTIQNSKPSKCVNAFLPPENSFVISSLEQNGYFVWQIREKTMGRHFWRTTSLSSIGSLGSTSSKESFITDDEENKSAENTDETVDIIYQGNSGPFFSEVMETFSDVLGEDNYLLISPDQIEKLKLEINASRLAYNISVDELARNIFYAFISLPYVHQSFANFSKCFKALREIWNNYYKNDANKAYLLVSIEDFSSGSLEFSKMVPKILAFLFNDEEFLPEEVLLDWYHGLPLDSPLISLPSVSSQMKQLMEFISQDDDEED